MAWYDLLFPVTPFFGNQNTGEAGLFTNGNQAWDQFKNGMANEYNKQIAEQNLDFQKQNLDYTKEIDQKNYQLQLDQFEYQKALQQQMFEREDTSYARTAQDMAKAGLNPLTMQGTNSAGDVIPTQAPQMPNNTFAMHNNMQWQDKGISSVLSEIASPVLSLLSGINEIGTLGSKRDNLTLLNQKQALENLVYAYENGISIDSDGGFVVDEDARGFTNRQRDEGNVRKSNADANRSERVDKQQEKTGITDNSTSTAQGVADALSMAKTGLDKAGSVISEESNTRKAINKIKDLTLSLADKASEKVEKSVEKSSALDKVRKLAKKHKQFLPHEDEVEDE